MRATVNVVADLLAVRAAYRGRWASLGAAAGVVLASAAAGMGAGSWGSRPVTPPWMSPPHVGFGFSRSTMPTMLEAFRTSGGVHATGRADDLLAHRGAVSSWARRVPCRFLGAQGNIVALQGWLHGHHLQCPVPPGARELLGPTPTLVERAGSITAMADARDDARTGAPVLLVTVVKATDDLNKTLVPWARWHRHLGVDRVVAVAIDCSLVVCGIPTRNSVVPPGAQEQGIDVRLWPPPGAREALAPERDRAGPCAPGENSSLNSACGLARSRMQTAALVSAVVRELLTADRDVPEWILHLDVDEYLAPGTASAASNVRAAFSSLATYLNGVRGVNQVHFLWRFFGPGNATRGRVAGCLPASHFKAEPMANVGSLVRDAPPFTDEPRGCPAKAFNRRPVAYKSAVRASALRPGIAISPHWFLATGHSVVADMSTEWILNHYALSGSGAPEARGWTPLQAAHFTAAFSATDVAPWARDFASPLCHEKVVMP